MTENQIEADLQQRAELRTNAGVLVKVGGTSMSERACQLGAGVDGPYIDGTWDKSAIDERWQHVHPATGEEDFSIAVCPAREVDRAVRAARRAFDDGPWSLMTARERKLALRPLGDLLRSHERELAELQSLMMACRLRLAAAFDSQPVSRPTFSSISRAGSTSSMDAPHPSMPEHLSV